jgi:hypothetical protein
MTAASNAFTILAAQANGFEISRSPVVDHLMTRTGSSFFASYVRRNGADIVSESNASINKVLESRMR